MAFSSECSLRATSSATRDLGLHSLNEGPVPTIIILYLIHVNHVYFDTYNTLT
jgi:hypothetical protein